jgi:hypothetical protein
MNSMPLRFAFYLEDAHGVCDKRRHKRKMSGHHAIIAAVTRITGIIDAPYDVQHNHTTLMLGTHNTASTTGT